MSIRLFDLSYNGRFAYDGLPNVVSPNLTSVGKPTSGELLKPK